MNREVTRIRTILLRFVLLAWIVSPAPAFGQSAARHLPGGVSPSLTFPVPITIAAPPQTMAVGIEDSPPPDWLVSNISVPGVYDAENHKVKWFFLASSIPAMVSYEVTLPAQLTGENCFLGTISFDGFDQGIEGDQCIVADCNENGIPDGDDLRDGTSDDLNGNGVPDECECEVDSECLNGSVCTYDRCVAQVCWHTANAYGDVNRSGSVNIFDLLCILSGFSGNFSGCSFEDDDIHPCEGNGSINIFDLLAVLGAFAGNDACCG